MTYIDLDGKSTDSIEYIATTYDKVKIGCLFTWGTKDIVVLKTGSIEGYPMFFTTNGRYKIIPQFTHINRPLLWVLDLKTRVVVIKDYEVLFLEL